MPHECTNCGRAFADGSKEMLSGCPECGGNKFQFRPSGSSSGSGTGATGSAKRDAAGSTSTESSAGSSPTGNAAAGSDASGGDSTRNDALERSTAGTPSAEATSTPDETKASADADSGSAVGRAASTVRGWVGSDAENDASADVASKRSESDVAPESEPDATPETPTTPEDVEDSAQASARTDVVTDDELPERSEAGEGTVASPPNDEQPSLEELREELNSQFESIKIVKPGQYELNLMELYEREEYVIALRENGRYSIQVPDAWTETPDD